MFVRIRGKGASPENSQAAVMHIRGFRHTHSPPPPNSYFSVLTSASGTASTSSNDGAAVSTSNSVSPPTTTMQPFRFALFPVGVHSAALTAAQTQHMRRSTAASPPADARCDETTAATLVPQTALEGEMARMLWTEIWNLYDILYDEVPLLPWVETTGDGAEAAAVTEALERELRAVASSSAAGVTATELRSLASLADITNGFKLASTLEGNHQVVVCPHYHFPSPLPESSFRCIGGYRSPAPAGPQTTASAASREGPVIVLDLAELPIALAGGKAMVNIAWYIAFAAMQPDSVLLCCRAVVVRLPYTCVPTYTQAHSHSVSSTSPSGAEPTVADAFRDMVDFIGEHISAVYHGMVLSLQATSPELAAKCMTAPPVVVVGSAPAALSSCLRSLLGDFPASDTERPDVASVLIFHGDHLRTAAVRSSSANGVHGVAEDCTAQMVKEYRSIAEDCGCPAAFETVLVPLRVLLERGEEPWDEYTRRERGRLNFCPCCGDCNHSNGDRSGSHSHGP
ncbi:hypothetical protein JKF63_06432 [Porcisia hertigi]|uniref:Uncharacterized protein n=1 Tax=Porcisia hertigi TaxID=2761500 RepID=A0A836YHN5_9TRYP|nr:hypothetical protein JKF63_06432 [Porcisia hertigi]